MNLLTCMWDSTKATLEKLGSAIFQQPSQVALCSPSGQDGHMEIDMKLCISTLSGLKKCSTDSSRSSSTVL